MIALSVRQPWAWLLLNGKDIENRDWYTKYRGPLAIHASKGISGKLGLWNWEPVGAIRPQEGL